jgi:hypothetical protein
VQVYSRCLIGQVKIFLSRSYSNGQYDPNWIVGKIKRAVAFMNIDTLQKYNFPFKMIKFLLSILNVCNL